MPYKNTIKKERGGGGTGFDDANDNDNTFTNKNHNNNEQGYGGGGGYQTTSYSATGGAGAGGGFFGGSQGGGGSQTTPSKAFNKSSLRPVTVKQMLEAQQPHPDSTMFTLDNNELTQVSFVGQIRNIVEQQTNITLKVDDGTGLVEVKQWLDPNSEPADAIAKAGIKDGQYVRIVGTLKDQGGRRHVGTHNIRPVVDHNEVLFHLLEVTSVHLYFTRGPLGEGGKPGGGGEYGGDTHMGDAGGTSGMGGGAAAGGGGGGPAGLSANAKRVYAAIKSVPDSNEGLHVNQIAEKTGMKIATVYVAVEELIETGVGFTTVDDDHIAIMD